MLFSHEVLCDAGETAGDNVRFCARIYSAPYLQLLNQDLGGGAKHPKRTKGPRHGPCRCWKGRQRALTRTTTTKHTKLERQRHAKRGVGSSTPALLYLSCTLPAIHCGSASVASYPHPTRASCRTEISSIASPLLPSSSYIRSLLQVETFPSHWIPFICSFATSRDKHFLCLTDVRRIPHHGLSTTRFFICNAQVPA